MRFCIPVTALTSTAYWSASLAVNLAFDALEALARRSNGVALSRREIAQLLESETNESLLPREGFPIHVRSDRNGANESALELMRAPFPESQRAFLRQSDGKPTLSCRSKRRLPGFGAAMPIASRSAARTG
jgi:hypothetical protein